MSFESKNKCTRTHIHWFTCDRLEDWLLYKISFRIFAECCHFDGHMLHNQTYYCHLAHKVVPVQDVGWMDGPWWSEGICRGAGLRALPNFDIWVHLGYLFPKWLWWQYLFTRWYVYMIIVQYILSGTVSINKPSLMRHWQYAIMITIEPWCL